MRNSNNFLFLLEDDFNLPAISKSHGSETT